MKKLLLLFLAIQTITVYGTVPATYTPGTRYFQDENRILIKENTYDSWIATSGDSTTYYLPKIVTYNFGQIPKGFNLSNQQVQDLIEGRRITYTQSIDFFHSGLLKKRPFAAMLLGPFKAYSEKTETIILLRDNHLKFSESIVSPVFDTAAAPWVQILLFIAAVLSFYLLPSKRISVLRMIFHSFAMYLISVYFIALGLGKVPHGNSTEWLIFLKACFFVSWPGIAYFWVIVGLKKSYELLRGRSRAKRGLAVEY